MLMTFHDHIMIPSFLFHIILRNLFLSSSFFDFALSLRNEVFISLLFVPAPYSFEVFGSKVKVYLVSYLCFFFLYQLLTVLKLHCPTIPTSSSVWLRKTPLERLTQVYNKETITIYHIFRKNNNIKMYFSKSTNPFFPPRPSLNVHKN